MKLTTLYQQKIQSIETFVNKSRLPATVEVQESFHERALHRQHQATCLAHCIAIFGDVDLSAADWDRLYARAENSPHIGYNPLQQGLDVAASAITGSSISRNRHPSA
ncbi:MULTISPECIES: hypothetical protein [Paraburkholderia]|jgi:hypothetical protein|uniref:hypothetical protein n=1 Tax=Paraburkholderia TaxID=1822464 RepID=UPI0038B83BC8